MSATTWCVVYNPTEDSQVVDDDGRTCYPQDFTYARRSFVKDLTDKEWLIVVNPDNITDDSVDAARLAKAEAQQRNDAIDADKAEAAAPAKESKPVVKQGKTSN